MGRLKDYLHIAAWQLGLAYIALWAIAFLALDYGPRLFAGACRASGTALLFYWSCDPSSPLAFVADVANTALTATVWAPVYVAAATVRPEALQLAIPILLVHLIGLPTALLVCIRLLARLVQLPRWLTRGRAHGAFAHDTFVQDGRVQDGRVQDGRVQDGRVQDGRVQHKDEPPPLRVLPPASALPRVKPRDTFGLRSQKP